MANVLVVHAHPEPKSFSSALARATAQACAAGGHQVAISDLYAMGFDPVSSRRNYRSVANPDFFKPQAEERHASEHDGFAPELDAEMRKLEACDLLVFSFPLWWFGPPAILKGWIDRVFAFGRIYGGGRWYDRGLGGGKRAMAILTTGSPASAFHRGGMHTDLETMLAPLHHGVFRFNGFAPLRPFVTWSAAHIAQEARSDQLDRLRERLAGVWAEPPASVPRATEHDAESWSDRTPRFLVTARPKQGRVPAGWTLSTRDKEALRELRRTGHLVRAMISNATGADWSAALEVRSENVDTALAPLRALPLAAACDFACAPIDLGLEDSLSPHWPAETV